jgi:uncharacterized protein
MADLAHLNPWVQECGSWLTAGTLFFSIFGRLFYKSLMADFFPFSWILIIELLLLGACGGFLAGLLGIGGGMVLVPFMTFFLSQVGFPESLIIKTAIATSLSTICFTSLSSVRAHARRGMVRWDLVPAFVPGLIVGSLVGAHLVKMLSAVFLTLWFALFVGFSATQMVRDKKTKPTRHLPGPWGLGLIGIVIGLLSAVVGAGGGFISVPFMTWCNVPIHQAVGTSAALGFPLALAGTVGYIWSGWSLEGLPSGTLGFIFWPALFIIASASVCTAPIGAKTAHAMNVKQLKRSFGVVLYLLAAYMLYKAIIQI